MFRSYPGTSLEVRVQGPSTLNARTMTVEQSTELVFFVNGKKVTEPNPNPDANLLEYLRDRLLLSGTKLSCGVGGCGACTVMLSWYDRMNKTTINKAMNACITPLCSVHGCAITTVEGVGSIRSGLHPIQARLVENHGIQCGFCTPGMVMSMYALLRTNHKPSRREIENALDGNLCRCTGYRSILQSVDSFSEEFSCELGEKCCKKQKGKVETKPAEQEVVSDYLPYDPSQEPIFPSELQVSDEHDQSSLKFEGENAIWLRPTNLPDFIKLKNLHPRAIIVGGFTHIASQEREDTGFKQVFLSVSGLSEARVTEETLAGFTLGAGLTINEAVGTLRKLLARRTDHTARGPAAVLSLFERLASQQLRNRVTIGGSLQANYPNSDAITPLVAAGASVVFRNLSGKTEEVLLMELCGTGKYVPIANGGVLLAVNIPFSTKDQYVFTFKQSLRRAMDRAVVNGGLGITFEAGTTKVQKAVLVFGGVGPSVLHGCSTVRHMIGKNWDDALLESASDILNEDLKSRVVGDKKDYRCSLALGYLLRFYKAVNQQSQGLPLEPTRCTTEPSRPSTQVFEEMPADQPKEDPVGRPKPHVYARQIATGEAVYYSDMSRREDELVLVMVRSTKAHAQIIGVDTSAALSMPGVVGYVGHEDVPGSNMCGMMKDEFIFAVDKVTNMGQHIGGIVAKTEEQARQAVKAVKVTYGETYPVITTIQEAISADSYHPGTEFQQTRGDTEVGLKEADHVKEGLVRVGPQEHFYMETQFVYVVPLENEEYEVFLGTQNITGAQAAMADALGALRSKVLIRQKRTGGAFGGKEQRAAISLTLCPAAVAAHKFQRPIRHRFNREEDLTNTGGRHPYEIKYKVGFKNDGQITAVEYVFYSNGGSSCDFSGWVGMYSVFGSEGAYYYPSVNSKVFICKTNTASPTAMRGFGRPQCLFATEHIIEEIAATLEVLPEQVRDKNLLADGNLTLYGRPVDGNLRRCWDQICSEIDLKAKREEHEEHNKNNRYKKKGLSIIPTNFGIGWPITPMWQGGAEVLVYQDGSVLLAHGAIEMGQGVNTKMIQVASRELGIPYERIHTAETGTNTVPNTTTTGGSTGTDLNGPAVIDACRKIKERLAPVIEANPDGSWNDWVGAAFVARINLAARGFYTHSDEKYPVAEWKPCLYYTHGVACTEVELDCLTGEHVVLQTDIVMDVGTSLNPGVDIGQIEGAFIQGRGLYTMEETKYDADGYMTTRTPDQYKIPTVKDIPRQFNVTLLKGSEVPKVVYSSKGIGEPPYALGMSVFYAIKDAVSYARKDEGLTGPFQIDSPATVERIRLACTDKITTMVTGQKDYVRPEWKH